MADFPDQIPAAFRRAGAGAPQDRSGPRDANAPNTAGARHGRRWQVFLAPPVLLGSGLLLLLAGSLPGLGLFLCMAALTALPIVAIRALLGP